MKKKFNIQLKANSWKFNHICTRVEKLPNDFFDESPFGKSLTAKDHLKGEPIDSNLKIEKFQELGFPKNCWETLKYGLPLLMYKLPSKTQTKNHVSVTESANLDFVKEALGKWEAAKIFRYVEVKPLVLNPLKVVVKEDKKRLVLDARTSGLNDCLLAPKFELPSLEVIVNMIKDRAFMMKTDLASGFLQLPINEKEQAYLGFLHPLNSRFCVIQRLPFGLRSAPFLFQTFTQLLEVATKEILQITTKVYMDDWFLTDPDEYQLRNNFEDFASLLEGLGISLQHTKTEGPATQLVYLGLGIDTIKHELFLPEVKRTKYLEFLSKLLQSSETTMEEIAKAAGRLVHISVIHKAGMGHVQPLWEIMYRERKIWSKRQLTREILQIEEETKECLVWWRNILEHPNITRRIWVAENQSLFIWGRDTALTDRFHAITICTDASDTGWGASTGVTVASSVWSEPQANTSINWRELKTVFLAIKQWKFIVDVPVLVLTDNMTVVAALGSRASRAQPLQDLVEEFNCLENSRKIEVVALHIPGVLNDLPDRLSRRMDMNTASMLTIRQSDLPIEVQQAEQLIGVCWPARRFDAQPFLRRQTLNLKEKTTLLAITTPDLPYLDLHLKRLLHCVPRIWIIIPKIPSSHLPITGFRMKLELEEGICKEAPQTSWWLLEQE